MPTMAAATAVPYADCTSTCQCGCDAFKYAASALVVTQDHNTGYTQLLTVRIVLGYADACKHTLKGLACRPSRLFAYPFCLCLGKCPRQLRAMLAVAQVLFENTTRIGEAIICDSSRSPSRDNSGAATLGN